MRRGTVAVVNPPGVGIADDKLAHVYVPEMIRFYLGEEPLLASADSYDLTDDDAREDVLGRLGEMVVKVRDRVGGEGVLIGEEAETRARRHRGSARRTSSPRSSSSSRATRPCSTASSPRAGSTCGR